MATPPILDNKYTSSESVFAPSTLLREARRQKALVDVDVPSVCIFDPDGDLVRRLRQSGAAKPFGGWPCYHTELDTFELGGHRVGIVGRVVGASFAVLVAEELFASGCQLLVSLTSAGQITPSGPPPYFVVIDPALRDEQCQQCKFVWRPPAARLAIGRINGSTGFNRVAFADKPIIRIAAAVRNAPPLSPIAKPIVATNRPIATKGFGKLGGRGIVIASSQTPLRRKARRSDRLRRQCWPLESAQRPLLSQSGLCLAKP